MCIDYSDEIAARVYELIQTQLLIEEVVRGSDCKHVELAAVLPSQFHFTILKSTDFSPMFFFLELFVLWSVLGLLNCKCFFYLQIR